MGVTFASILSWDAIAGAADYRVRVDDVNGVEVSRIFTTATQVGFDTLLSGSPSGTYYVYVAAKDVAGAGNGTVGQEASVTVTLDAQLPAPTLTIS